MATNYTSKLRQLGLTEPTGVDIVTKMATQLSLSKYLWNLPPHESSLPVDPALDSLTVDTTRVIDYAKPESLRDNNSVHALRRGRIYWFSRVDAETINGANKNSGLDARYGFQFLWNPSEITTSVQVNMDITPSSADKFTKVVGAFPSGEYLTLNVEINRINDFFAIKSLSDNQSYKDVARAAAKSYTWGSLEDIYREGDYKDKNASISSMENKIIELQKYGTLADIEYLYKAINGPGWVNQASGRNSSDIGFLSPTLLKIEIGPIQYVGYVQSLNVMHTQFSKSMIPIRSTVSMQFNLMATAGLASGGK